MGKYYIVTCTFYKSYVAENEGGTFGEYELFNSEEELK